MTSSTLKKLAISSIKELIAAPPFFVRKKHLIELDCCKRDLEDEEVSFTNQEIINKIIHLRKTIHSSGWLGIPGWGCGYFLKKLDLLLRSFEVLTRFEQEANLETNAIRHLAVMAGNDILSKQDKSTDKSRIKALQFFTQIAYSPHAPDTDLIMAAEQSVHFVKTQGHFGLFKQRGSYFLERMESFIKQAKAILVKSPYPYIKPIQLPKFQDESSVNSRNEIKEKTEPARTLPGKALDHKRIKLEQQIYQILNDYKQENSFLIARWRHRAIRIEDGARPTILFFDNFKSQLQTLNDNHPERKLNELIDTYKATIKKPSFETYWHEEELKKHLPDWDITAPKPMKPFLFDQTLKKQSLFANNSVSITSLVSTEREFRP